MCVEHSSFADAPAKSAQWANQRIEARAPLRLVDPRPRHVHPLHRRPSRETRSVGSATQSQRDEKSPAARCRHSSAEEYLGRKVAGRLVRSSRSGSAFVKCLFILWAVCSFPASCLKHCAVTGYDRHAD